jgi:ribose-phosphate pyrophosphokinase
MKTYPNTFDEILIHYKGSISTATIPIESYPDTTPMIKYQPWSPVSRMLLRPRSISSFMAAMWWVDAYLDRGMPPFQLILPNVPGARQDRITLVGDYLFTLKSVAKEINLRNFTNVVILDPHSDVAPALIERSNSIHAHEIVRENLIGKYDGVISPDAGAEKRAGGVAKWLGVPLLHAWKTRDVTSGEITGFGMQAAQHGGRYLIVDDLCDGGGTFLGLWDIAPLGGGIDLYTTHGIYSKGTESLAIRFNKIYTTDSVYGPRNGVVEIRICKRLLETGHV